MKIRFKDPVFDGQLLRALSHVYYGGADVGECVSTAARIREGDATSWHDEWSATAQRIYSSAEVSLQQGRARSAREAFLRASNYFRTSYIFLMSAPLDPRATRAFDRQTDAFRKAAALFSSPVEQIEIPYDGRRLPGYFYRAGAGDQPCRTLILTGGYDGTSEELYFFNAEAALRRGYNCICFDGPGQGAALIKDGLYFRPDWENVVRPVVDYLLTRTDVDPARIA